MEQTAPPSQRSDHDAKKADVLIVDDDQFVRRALRRILVSAGYTVATADDGQQAIPRIMEGGFDVVLSDVHMPNAGGTEMLQVLRSYGCQIPVILMSGNPTFDTAQEAVSLGAVEYLTKPVARDALLRAVSRARDEKKKLDVKGQLDPAKGAGFDRALGSLYMAFQPIVQVSTGRAFAYEALMRSREPGFFGPGPMLEYAEKSKQLQALGRAVRSLCADGAANAPNGALIFVNLHVEDLADPDLFSPQSPLIGYADRVVLEITERGALDEVDGVRERIDRLRRSGFRVAIDDLGAGYAGLTSVALLEPEFVKLDMSLTRGLDSSPLKQRLVKSMVDACRGSGMQIVAEGVETIEERDCLIGMGCDLLQGYYFAKPQEGFISIDVKKAA